MAPSTPNEGERRQRWTARALALTCALLVSPAVLSPVGVPGTVGAARAQEAIEGEVLVILASEAPGSIAPELAGIDALRQAPFSSYRSMTLLASHPVSLVLGRPTDIPLPNGRVMQVIAEERQADGRVRTRVAINRPGERDYLPGATLLLPRCEPLLIAGQSFGGGTLVLGVRLGTGCS